MGLYTLNNVASGTATLVARTDNDATILTTQNVLQSRAFGTAGGYPSTYTLAAGSTYAFGVIFVGTGNGNTIGQAGYNSTYTGAVVPKVALRATGQTDLPTSIVATGNATVRYWGRFT